MSSFKILRSSAKHRIVKPRKEDKKIKGYLGRLTKLIPVEIRETGKKDEIKDLVIDERKSKKSKLIKKKNPAEKKDKQKEKNKLDKLEKKGVLQKIDDKNADKPEKKKIKEKNEDDKFDELKDQGIFQKIDKNNPSNKKDIKSLEDKGLIEKIED